MIEQARRQSIPVWHQLILTLELVIFLLFSSLMGTAQAQATINPERIEVSLEPGACAEETVTITMGETPFPSLDVALVIDVTGSMSYVIDEVTRSSGRIAADIRALVPDSTFALVTLADYPGEGDAGDYPWRLDQDFTHETNRLQTALDNIELQDGGDEPESYLRALYETQFLNWREGSRRVVILFGDSYPHDPDPGRDEIQGTGDDLTQEETVDQLAAADITVLTVYATPFRPDFYEAVAGRTGGQAFYLGRVEEIPQAVQQMIEATVTRIRTLTLEPSDPGDTWVEWEPGAHHDVAPLDARDFALTLCVPAGTAGGDYAFDLTAIGDGAAVGRIPVLVHVPEPTPTSTPTRTPTPVPPPVSPAPRFPWWWLIVPVLLVLLLAGLWWWRGRRDVPTRRATRPSSRQTPQSPGRPMQKPTRRPRGADVTHDRDQPAKR